MQNESFKPRLNPFPTHQINQFQSQIPQNVAANNPYNVNAHQLQPSSLQSNHLVPLLPSFPSDFENRLRDEVIYLHSLWHRGPPSANNRPSQTITPLFLRPSAQIPFKKKSKKSSKALKSHLISDKEWPVETKPKSPSPPSGSGWPKFKPNPSPISRPATAEERERVLAVKLQLKALDSCSGLFGKAGSSDSEDEDDDVDEEEDDVDDPEAYDFLMKVFEEDDELRGFYEKKYENGEFYCLVCGVIGDKLTRKYKNCVALVQHAVSISKTKKKAAHRAYGHVICKVLGWDINRLPSFPSALVDASFQSCEIQSSKSKVDADGCEVDDDGGMKIDGVCCDSENVPLEQNNIDNSAQEVASELGEGCSTLGSKSVGCGSSITGDVAK